MKGGGLTWAGWLMVGIGGLLVYAGMTGQSLVGELQAVLTGKSPKDSGEVVTAAGFGGGGEFPDNTAPAPRPRPQATVPPPAPRVPPKAGR